MDCLSLRRLTHREDRIGPFCIISLFSWIPLKFGPLQNHLMRVGVWEGLLFHVSKTILAIASLMSLQRMWTSFHENHIENKQWMQWESFVRRGLEDSFMPHLPTKDLRDLPPRNDTLTQIWELAKVFNTPLTYPPPFYDLPWIYCSTAPESNFKKLKCSCPHSCSKKCNKKLVTSRRLWGI